MSISVGGGFHREGFRRRFLGAPDKLCLDCAHGRQKLKNALVVSFREHVLPKRGMQTAFVFNVDPERADSVNGRDRGRPAPRLYHRSEYFTI
jgi:hypothetical protein